MIRPASRRVTRAALALFFFSVAAHATPSVKDVVAAIDSGDINGADIMLREVLATYPNNARAHFIDAQVLGMEGRAADGLEQLHTAEQLDPSLHFASAARVAKVEAKLNAELAKMQGAAQQQVAPGIAPAPAVHISPAPAATTDDGGETAAIVGLLAALIVMLVIFLVVRHRRKQARIAEEMRRELMSRMTTLMSDVRAIGLDSRLSADGAAKALAPEAAGLERAVRDGLAILTAGRAFPEHAVSNLERYAADLRSRLDGRASAPAPGAAYLPGRVGVETAPSAADWRSPGTGSATVYAPQTIYVENNPDIVSAVILADALRADPVVVERDVYVERPVYLQPDPPVVSAPAHVESSSIFSRANDDDDDIRRGGGVDLDVGNGGSNWDSGGDGGGSVDSGDGGGGGWD
ncbi:tetratricopeptide repeat protein [Paraburkholderia youngii]|uniref:tetratricopeptide repeat protein n=1 Tax=Paraburkholderia youngii TaxID=2782701 RepID=UPI003D1C5AF7